MMANDSGLDTEMVQAGEPVPWAAVRLCRPEGRRSPITADISKTGEIKGTVMAAEPYIPGQGGLVGQGGANGQSGIRYPRPLDDVWIALNDFDNGDQIGFVTENDADGTFDIKNVKDGTYLMSVWDIDQDYAFDCFNVTGRRRPDGRPRQRAAHRLVHQITGHVFIDNNANGKRDPGEPGVPNFDVTIKNRTNDLYVSGQNLATTDFKGNYHVKEGYPTGAFIIEEFFNTRYKTTGVTYQADNDPQEHTVLTAAVDISLNHIIGQDGRVDIGVLPYDSHRPPTATPHKCTTPAKAASWRPSPTTRPVTSCRARKAATEDYEPASPASTWRSRGRCRAPAPRRHLRRNTHLRDQRDGSFATRDLSSATIPTRPTGRARQRERPQRHVRDRDVAPPVQLHPT